MTSPVPNLNDALLSVKPTSAEIRVGVVTSDEPDFLTVNIGGSEFVARYIVSYDTPYPGDLVACVRQDSSWLVLGRIAGSGINLVSDPGFELQPAGTALPLGAYSATIPWSLWDFPGGGAPAGATTAVYTVDTLAPEGKQVLRIGPLATAQNVIALSSPINVIPGQRFSVSAFVGGDSQPETPTGDAELYACWFSSATETWRSGTLTTDATFIAQFANVPNAPAYVRLSGSVVVPSNIPTNPFVMRIGIRSNTAINIGMRFGYTLTREVGV